VGKLPKKNGAINQKCYSSRADPFSDPFPEYFSKVDELRAKLRTDNKRYVITKTGTRIDCPTGRKLHKGVLLSYLAQGTIADFINKAALKIISLEKIKGWRLVAPCHDGLYVICKPVHIQELHEITMSCVVHYPMCLEVKKHKRETT